LKITLTAGKVVMSPGGTDAIVKNDVLLLCSLKRRKLVVDELTLNQGFYSCPLSLQVNRIKAQSNACLINQFSSTFVPAI
jgi:hypothetical protein